MLVELAARGFRNLDPLTWRPSAGQHLLLGENGAGKTSLLEAVYTLATTRSFRAPRLVDCRHHEAAGFYLAAEVEGAANVGLARLELSLVEGQRQRRLNGSTVSMAEHLAALPVISWTSADVSILNGPPEVRRRFLDRGILGLRPGALADLGRYRRTLAQKRELLQQGGGRGALESWNGVLATTAAAVILARGSYVEALRKEFAQVLEEVDLGFPAVTLRYRPSPAGVRDLVAHEEVVTAITRVLESRVEEERRRGTPLVGPHRDELYLGWQDHQLRRVASAGERKCIGLALLAAHGRVLEARGKSVVYLLDDADTELSANTLKALWRSFRGARQLFASSNRSEIWRGLPMEHQWHLHHGALEAL